MKKVLLIICVSFLAICQLNIKSIAYTIDEAKAMIDFKTVAEDGEPEKFDVFIDLSELKDDEEWPCGIRNKIDNILFDNEDNLKLRDINFFNTKTNNTDTHWLAFRDFVKTYYHIALYFSTAVMLTLLIYIGIVIAISTFTNKELKIPMGKIANENGGNIGLGLKKKKFFEEWIKTFFIIVLMVYIINVIIAFSGIMHTIVNSDDEPEENNIIVYVANANGVKNPTNSDIDTTDAYYFKTNLEGLLMFESQYKVQEKIARNLECLITVLFIRAFMFIIEVLFIIRMVAVALLTVLAPIIVLLNGFKVIAGNKGFLQKWFKLYLYFIFIKPLIALIYYVMVKTNPDLVIERPSYTIFVMFFIVIIIVFYIKSMIKSMK